jgi:hypothetical protein
MKRSKTFRTIAALALAFALALTGFTPVFAAPGDLPALEGTETNTPPVAITKIFQTPEGTIVPNATFAFDFAPYGIGSPGTAVGDIPDIGSVHISVANTDVKATSNYIDTITKEGLVDFSGLDFSDYGVGQYIYTITENATVAGYDAVGNVTIYTHESEAKYELSLYVAEKAVGSDYFIEYITVRKVMNDDGSSLGVNEEKVDPTPGAHGLAFVNTYVKANDGKPGTNDDPDPEDTDFQNIIVEKMVTNENGSHINGVNTYFPFTVEINNVDFVADTSKSEPNLAPPLLNVYKAYVLEWDPDGISPGVGAYLIVDNLTPNGGAPFGTDSNGYPFYQFTVDQEQSLKLKDGQQLVFTRTPVGTHWVASEMLSTDPGTFGDYTASILVTVNDVMDPVITGSQGGDATTLPRLVGEGDTNALFKNYEGFTPPLGLDINNLPYYGLILLALLALAAYVAVRARKRRQNAYEFDSYDA